MIAVSLAASSASPPANDECWHQLPRSSLREAPCLPNEPNVRRILCLSLRLPPPSPRTIVLNDRPLVDSAQRCCFPDLQNEVLARLDGASHSTMPQLSTLSDATRRSATQSTKLRPTMEALPAREREVAARSSPYPGCRSWPVSLVDHS